MDAIAIGCVVLGVTLLVVIFFLRKKKSQAIRKESDTTTLSKDLHAAVGPPNGRTPGKALGDARDQASDFSIQFFTQSEMCAKLKVTLAGLRKLTSSGKVVKPVGSPPTYSLRTPTRRINRAMRGHRRGDLFVGDDGYIYDAIDMFMHMVWLDEICDILEPEYIEPDPAIEDALAEAASGEFVSPEDDPKFREMEETKAAEIAPEPVHEPHEPVREAPSQSASWTADSSASDGGSDYDSGGDCGGGDD